MLRILPLRFFLNGGHWPFCGATDTPPLFWWFFALHTASSAYDEFFGFTFGVAPVEHLSASMAAKATLPKFFRKKPKASTKVTLTKQFRKLTWTNEWYFVIQWMQVQWWGHSNPT